MTGVTGSFLYAEKRKTGKCVFHVLPGVPNIIFVRLHTAFQPAFLKPQKEAPVMQFPFDRVQICHWLLNSLVIYFLG